MSALLDGLTPYKRYLFGTAAKAVLPQDIVVNDHAKLGKHFLPFQTWVGETTIGSELGKYQNFNTRNFVFGSDRLDLVGLIDRKKFKGGYDPVVATLAKDPVPGNGGGTVLFLTDWPKEPIDGAMFGWQPNESVPLARRLDYRVAGIAAGAKMVVIFPALHKGDTPKAGGIVRFTPPITTAQIWTKDAYALGKGRPFVFEAVLDVPGDDAKGAFPAFWLYSKHTDETLKNNPAPGDEIDVAEMQRANRDRNARHFAGPNHVNNSVITYHKEDEGWKPAFGGSWREAPEPIVGENTFTGRVDPAQTHKAVNGVLIRSDDFTWRSKSPAEAGINLAIAPIAPAYRFFDIRPTSDECFKNMRLGIKSVSIYA